MDTNNNLTPAAGKVILSTDEYAELVKRSFALDVILTHSASESYRLDDTVKYVKTALIGSGVTVLSNEFCELSRGDNTVVLAGIDDPNGYADQKTPEALAAEIYAAYGDPFWVLLAHRNDRFASQYSLLGADLTISGHGHGGCIRLPLTDGLLGTQHNLLPSHTAGFYEDNGAVLFVSRGLGNVGHTFRIFNRAQVAVITLERG